MRYLSLANLLIRGKWPRVLSSLSGWLTKRQTIWGDLWSRQTGFFEIYISQFFGCWFFFPNGRTLSLCSYGDVLGGFALSLTTFSVLIPREKTPNWSVSLLFCLIPSVVYRRSLFFGGGEGGGAFSESLRLGFTVYLSKHLGLRTTISNLFCSSLSIFCENGFFADFPRMVTIRFVKRWFFLFMGSFYFIKPYQNNDIWANSVCSPLHFAFDSQRYPAGLMRLDLRMFQTN